MRLRHANRVALIAAGVLLAGCAHQESRPASIQMEIGHHRLRLAAPMGWEHLDHGRQQLFRMGESELALEDLGPASRAGLVNELREARALMVAGRRGEAFERVRWLHGPPVFLLPQPLRADFWRPWTDATYIPETADSLAVLRAFDTLIHAAENLPDTPMKDLTDYVLTRSASASRSEIARKDVRVIHDVEWTDIETWNRVSHMDRERLALADDGGYLLTLATRRGLYAQTGPAFDSLLASIELLPR
jgi:hypothetical protein